MATIDFKDPETGKTVSFAVEEQTQLNGVNYLLVSEGEDAYILKEISVDGEESIYEMVEDDVEFDALAKIFSELLDEETDLEYDK